MQEAVAVREAALDAVDGVVPAALRSDIEAFVDDGSLVPGVLTLLSARAAGADGAAGPAGDGGPADDGGPAAGGAFDGPDGAAVDGAATDGAAADDAESAGGEPGAAYAGDPDGLAGRAAGVQLIYDGLRLTRRLVHAEPWPGAADAADGGPVEDGVDGHGVEGDGIDGTGVDGDGVEADMDILVADVLVARGFYLLARTEAATVAVDVVRSFGRDQTERRGAADPDALDRELERDVLRLAVVAGVTAAGREPSAPDSLVGDLAAAYDGGFPAPESLFDQQVRDRVAGVVGPRAVNRND